MIPRKPFSCLIGLLSLIGFHCGLTAAFSTTTTFASRCRSKSASLLPVSASPKSSDSSDEHNDNNSNELPYRPGSLMAATLEQGRVPYGEESRKYRRTVFTHSDWVSHRNSERIVTNLQGIFFSGVVRQLKSEVSLVASVAALILVWNGIVVPSEFVADHLEWTLPLMSLPALPFTLSSPALGLLLVFRTNASYARWQEARTTWARIISQSRNMVRMAATFCDLSADSSVEAVERLRLASWLYCRTLMNQLLGPVDEESYHKEVISTFSGETDTLIQQLLDLPNTPSGDDRTMAALSYASLALDQIPIDEKRRVEIDKSLVLMTDSTAICEKIFCSPVPLVYTRHTARFLSLWMLLLPTAMYDVFKDFQDAAQSPFALHGIALVPASAIVALFLFGIDELAVQLEEPFSILPLQDMCDSVKQDTARISSWCRMQQETQKGQ